MSFYKDFAPVYEKIFPVRDVAARFVGETVGLPPRRVLDVGCGPGRLSARLEVAGYTCTGIDLDTAMIERAQEEFPNLDVRLLDMRRVGDLEKDYDAAVCLGNVLPHLDRVDVSGFLGALHHRMVPGAVWVVQTVNFDRLAGMAEYDFPPLAVEGGYEFHRRYEGLDGDRCRFLTRLEREGEELFAGETGMTALGMGELVERHRAAGFEMEGAWGDFEGGEYEEAGSLGRVMVFRRG